MKKLLNKYTERFIDYMQRTIENKLYALLMFIVGLISVPVLDGDGTFCLVAILMALALFFAKDDIFEMEQVT